MKTKNDTFTINVGDRVIEGKPSEKAWDPMPEYFKPFGQPPAIKTPTAWKKHIRENIGPVLEAVYAMLDQIVIDAPEGSLDGDLYVEWLEEKLSPTLDQIVIDSHYYAQEEEKEDE